MQVTNGLSPRTFLRSLELVEFPSEESSTRVFSARTQYVPWPKAYGGELVAQGLAAMIRTVSEPKHVHSLHSYFLRPASVGVQVRYEVELLRDGRSFSTRQLRAVQNEEVIFVSTASFQTPVSEDHFHIQPDPSGIATDPEGLQSSASTLANRNDELARYWISGRSFEMRYVGEPVYEGEVNNPIGHQNVWIKPLLPLPQSGECYEDTNLRLLALAYVSDYTILESILRRTGLTWSSNDLVTASLDHSIWFHQMPNVDDWILYQQQAIAFQSERGLSEGYFFDREGALLASVVQEGLLRT